MRILAISEYYEPFGQGGGEKSMQLLLEEVSRQGHTVDILTSSFKGAKKIEKTNKNLQIYRLTKTGKNPSKLSSNLKRILIYPLTVKIQTKKLIKRNKYDLIHYFNLTSSSGYIKTNTKQICHVNSPVPFCPKGNLFFKDKEECKHIANFKTCSNCIKNSKTIGKTKFNMCALPLWLIFKLRFKKFNKFNQYVAISNYIKDKIAQNYEINKSEIEVLPNSIELSKFKPKNNFSKDKPLKLLYIGEFTTFKGVYKILDICKNLKIPYICNFYGKGIEKNNLKKQIKLYNLDIKLNNQVKYDKIIEVFSNHDIKIIPSIWPEAFGRIAIEAMASKTLVLASKNGGLKDIITNKKNGVFITKDALESAKFINTLSERKYNEIIKQALIDSKIYSTKNISKKYLEIIKWKFQWY